MKWNIIYGLAFLILTLSCQKADLSAIENLSDNQIAIIGHGGSGFPSPEVNIPANSFESVRRAVEGYQADGVEIDIQLSADSVLFLYHDDRLQTLTDCVGCLYQYESSDLEECKYVAGFNQNFNDHKLVQLDKILAHFDQRIPKPLIFLDIKTSPDCPHTFDIRDFEGSFIKSLKEIFEKYNCQDWVITESADYSLLIKLMSEIPDLKTSYFSIINEQSIDIALENGFYGLSSLSNITNREAVTLAHDSGLFITIGIVKIRRDAIEAINLSPDFIYTDNIPLLQSILH